MEIRKAAIVSAMISIGCSMIVGGVGSVSHADTPTIASTGTTYEGKVTQASSDTFTIMSKYGDRPITVKTGTDTQFNVTTDISQNQLAVGQIVLVMGKVDPTKQQIEAALIYVPSVEQQGYGRAGQARRNKAVQGAKAGKRIIGKITAVSPDLNIITRSGSYTVLTRPLTMIVTRSRGSAADVKLGTTVRVRGGATGDVDNKVINATVVDINDASLRGKLGLGRKSTTGVTTDAASSDNTAE